MTSYFIQAFIYLSAAVILVPLSKRIGLGSVLGYLIAGVLIGPVLGLVGQETTTIQHFAEFGVVMMLFLVGLELEPKILWAMRSRLIGLGGLQVLVTTAVFTSIAFGLGLHWQLALAVGLILSLSSTAVVLQTFQEKGYSKLEGGRSAFSVLLFQDIAVIPILALLPLLALPELAASPDAIAGDAHKDLNLIAHLPPWAMTLSTLIAIVVLVVVSNYLSRPLFRYVAAAHLREVFTATALMLVVGIAALMGLVGLSPALGVFLAGVVLANSEFRHELEVNIEPFKGLLLGLFFITVGAGIDFSVLKDHGWIILGLTLGLMLLKLAILYLLARLFGLRSSDRWLFCLSLAQAGEFGFVLLSYALSKSVVDNNTAQFLSLVVALSMFLTPLLFIVFEKAVKPRYRSGVSSDTERPAVIDQQGPVIIAGAGRFGQIVNRFLRSNGVETVLLDRDLNSIDRARQVNVKTYYGDASHPNVLHAAGVESACLLIIAINDPKSSLEMVEETKRHYPELKILVRSYDRAHSYRLRDIGVDYAINETSESALILGSQALLQLGKHPYHVESAKSGFAELEEIHDDELFDAWKDDGALFGKKFIETFNRLQSTLFEKMQHHRHADGEDTEKASDDDAQ
jgi:CPA2 family monovalent cation:H+ antiporter-2/glutathione-regulated potassium-efflux system ancillary protein KefC